MYKKMSLWACVGLLYFFQNVGLAQDSLKVQILEAVFVQSTALEKYLAGTKMMRLDSQILHQTNGKALGEVLMQHTPIYVKQYGNGMLASISFRGTGSNHTAVIWNGMNLNALTVGSSDLGILPVFATENIDIQYGSASSLYGSDAIGGAIYLHSKAHFEDSFRLNYQQNFGSFGTYFSGLRTRFGTKKWQAKTKIYHAFSENNFLFRNTAKRGHPTEKQTHAQTKNYGISQSFDYRLNARNLWQSEIWFHATDRNLAHTMSRVGQQTGETQKDESLRISMQFTKHLNWGSFFIKSGFISDKLNYNETSETSTNRLIFSAEYETEFSKNIGFRLGGKTRKITAHVDNYGQKITENRSDIFALFRWQISSVWDISLNARQAFVTGFAAPFSPSFGSNLKLLKRAYQSLTLKNLASRSYRVPTLNDRYWKPGGNPDILPENAISVEGGLVYLFEKKKIRVQGEITHFRMWVKNWILWRPTGQFWSPMNLGKVQSNGIEFSGNFIYRLENGHLKTGGNYAYTKSINKKKRHEYDQSVDKQLIYTPLYRATAYTEWAGKRGQIGINFQYTGKRFTLSDNSEFLNGFGLWDAQISKTMDWKKHQFTVRIQAKNILNKSYQNLQNYAMPARHFLWNLNYQL